MLVLVGPTASGKSSVAMALARSRSGTELVYADAMAVYRGMDIGTATPTAAERAEVPHHGLDLVEPEEDWTVVDHQRVARRALADIEARAGHAILVGGTGLYVRAIVDGFDPPGRWPAVHADLDEEPSTARLFERLQAVDPAAARKVLPTNRRRIVRALEVCVGSGRPFSSFGPGVDAYSPTVHRQVGLRWSRPALAGRITRRFEAMLAAGLLAEVEALAARPGARSRTATQALGYRELLDHLAGRLTLDEATHLAVTRTRQLAVRQERWFRRDPRIHWIELHDDPLEASSAIAALATPAGPEPSGQGAPCT